MQSKVLWTSSQHVIYPYTIGLCNLEMIRMCKIFQHGKWSCLVWLGDHVRVLTPINGCHFTKKYCLNISGVNFGKNVFLGYYKCNLHANIAGPFNLWTIFDSQGILCIYVVSNMGQFTYSNCKVASSLWLAHFVQRICGDAQLLSFSHLVVHTKIPLIFQMNSIVQMSFFGGGMPFSCASLPFKCHNLKIYKVFTS